MMGQRTGKDMEQNNQQTKSEQKNDEKKISWSAEEIHKTEFEPVPQTVEGILERGSLSIFAGAPKAGKSFFSLDLAISVAMGRNFLTDHESDQGEVLLLALEDTPRRISNRMSLMVNEYDNVGDLKNLTVMTECPRQDEGGKLIIADWIKQDSVKDPKLLIVDTLFRFRPTSTLGGGYKNDAFAVEWLHKLAQTANISVLVLHHDIKSKASSWENTISGSKGLTGIVDGIMLLKKYMVDGKKEGLFFSTSRDLEEIHYRLRFDGLEGRWIKHEDQVIDIEAMAEQRPEPPHVLKVQEFFILHSGEIWTNQDVIAGTELSEGTVKAALSYLARKGFLNRVARGRYRLAPAKTEG